ncbi:hypothetical protein ACFL0D_09220 [Thermoproteota archaeon]
MSSSTSRRKMLAAQEDIANRIVELAKRKDMTVYQTVNDILEQALRVEELGMSLKQVVDERWMLERAQETGFTFTIEQLLYRIVDEAFDSDRERFTDIWREMGHWYGKYYQAKHDEPLEAFREALELFTIGTSEYKLENSSRDLTFSFIGEKLTPGYIELYCVFIEELLSVLGYKIKEKEINRGIIKLEMRR